ncbi:hypothetical protein E1B28_011037 [Marasmius oreades]|uniref:Cytochrome b5 heme-binding domain-containing protein n=1 Tax=Marasmius oreades TaxID=181124 RepID=A0A9P7RTS6_9AGAR|nr:uncharacterized protein E1B28_011037 [Marasmius oreades]KAG7089347.1 hypothetical protein E1B28_011037 [Marasmius oreades]
MTSYLRSWFPSFPTEIKEEQPKIEITEQADDDSGSETEREDAAPAFPSLNSAQRVKSTPTTASQRTDAELMPPPPLPSARTPSFRMMHPSSSLSVQATTKPPVKPKGRNKVALAPGHSPLDWAALKSSGVDLRGVPTLLRVTPSVLKQHRHRDDAWTAINGKVYNLTPYLPFHPGGEKELMRVAGRDGTKLFLLTHSWVNVDFMLDGSMVGFLVPEPSS